MRETIVDSLDALREFTKSYLAHVSPKERAYIIGLHGNLGAGKTAFVKQVATFVGINDDVTSPTFVIQKNYPIDWNGFTQLVHIDAYRLETGEDMKPLKFSDTLAEKENLILIEWPEQIQSVLPDDIEHIQFDIVDGETRKITHI